MWSGVELWRATDCCNGLGGFSPPKSRHPTLRGGGGGADGPASWLPTGIAWGVFKTRHDVVSPQTIGTRILEGLGWAPKVVWSSAGVGNVHLGLRTRGGNRLRFRRETEQSLLHPWLLLPLCSISGSFSEASSHVHPCERDSNSHSWGESGPVLVSVNPVLLDQQAH